MSTPVQDNNLTNSISRLLNYFLPIETTRTIHQNYNEEANIAFLAALKIGDKAEQEVLQALQNGANPNLQHPSLEGSKAHTAISPLQYATINNAPKTVQHLLRYGAGSMANSSVNPILLANLKVQQNKTLLQKEKIDHLKMVTIKYIPEEALFRVKFKYIKNLHQQAMIIERILPARVEEQYVVFENSFITLSKDNHLVLQGDWPAHCAYIFEDLEKLILSHLSNPLLIVKIRSKETAFVGNLAIRDLNVVANRCFNHHKLQVNQANIIVDDFINTHAELISGKAIVISAVFLNNHQGKIHAAETCQVKARCLDNLQGEISGVHTTQVKIYAWLTQNKISQIGVRGDYQGKRNAGVQNALESVTIVKYLGTAPLMELGIIRGDTLRLVNIKTPGTGTLAAHEIILKHKQPIMMPQVDIEADTLNIYAPDFQLKKNGCQQTIWKLAAQNTRLSHVYQTSGILILEEEGMHRTTVEAEMHKRFGEIHRYDLATLPKAEYCVDIQANIQADNGVLFLCPKAQLKFGTEQKVFAELVALKKDITLYATEVDAPYVGIVAKHIKIWSPRGVYLGRLMEDPNREVMATFYAHSYTNVSHNLSDSIVQQSYSFLGQPRAVYDGRHLLCMPMAIPNGSFLNTAQGNTHIIGPLYHHGELETHNLTLNSPNSPALIEAGKIIVKDTCRLTGDVLVKNYTTTFQYGYYQCEKTQYIPGLSAPFCNSDQAMFIVQGQTVGRGVVTNEGAYTAIHAKENVRTEAKNFSAGLYQKVISGTPAERLALRNSRHNIRASISGFVVPLRYPAGITIPNNWINDYNGGIHYAVGFLTRTQNFQGAQKVFPAVTDYQNTALLSHHHTRLEGILNAPAVLIKVGNALALGSANPYYLPPQDPIRHLMQKSFNERLNLYAGKFKAANGKSDGTQNPF